MTPVDFEYLYNHKESFTLDGLTHENVTVAEVVGAKNRLSVNPQSNVLAVFFVEGNWF
jgi:hypothetical protein